jgi:hypothetical protein
VTSVFQLKSCLDYNGKNNSCILFVSLVFSLCPFSRSEHCFLSSCLPVFISIAVGLDFSACQVDSLHGSNFVFSHLAGFVGRLWISTLVPWSTPLDLTFPDFIFASRLKPLLSLNISRAPD